jgi:uncharacterized membrane protein YeiH
MNDAIAIVDVVAVGVFAISGALAAAEKNLDILGFILFGTITGIGGGTVRDLLLDTDAVFWIADTHYLWTCFAVSTATWFLAPQFQSLHKVLLWADAVGMALFSVLGAIKALQLGAPEIVAVVMGMMTATFGSLIRDTLLHQKPVLLGPEIYVTAALLGASSYVLLQLFPAFAQVAMPAAIILAFLMRAAAITLDLRLPKYGTG